MLCGTTKIISCDRFFFHALCNYAESHDLVKVAKPTTHVEKGNKMAGSHYNLYSV